LVSAYAPVGKGRARNVEAPSDVSAIGPREDVIMILDAAAAGAKKEGVEVQEHPVEGDPADALLTVAEQVKADLIMVGNKGMAGARRILGSVPNNVSHHAPCSVMIVSTT
jgi:nucleotide-binding universal stress UspA family protein